MLVVTGGMFAQSPATVLDEAVGKIQKAGSVSCKFRIASSADKLSGTLMSSGSKFRLDTPAGKTWFDGKKMWTSNPRSKEITLVNPSSQEVREINPFAYLNSYRSDFVVAYSKRKDPASHLVLLNPRDKKSDIKAVEVAINKKTMLPERFIIRDNRDRITTVYVDALSITDRPSAESFACPVEKMTDYELVDLR